MGSSSDVRELWERGRTAWPGIELELDVFADHLVRRVGETLDRDALGRICAEDLYLACACARGQASAVSRFETEYASIIERAVARIDGRPAVTDELRQALLVRLLVPANDGEEPRIAHYSGRGSLVAWIRIAAGRLALNARRDAARKGHTELDDQLVQNAAHDTRDPEVEYLRTRYQSVFMSCLKQALVELDAEHRSLLRLHYVEALTMDALAELFRTSRAGIHRRVAASREALFEGTCTRMREQLGLDTAELESMLRLVRSQLDVSLTGLLESEPA